MLSKIIWGILLTAHMVASVDYHDTIDISFEDLNKAQLKDFLNCLLDKAPCSEIAASYKQHYPTFIKELCSRCTRCQKHNLYVFWNRIRAELPEDWKEYRVWFDPENKYIDKIYSMLVDKKKESYC